MDTLLEQTRNIYAVGRNYRAHAAELGNPIPREPVLFGKALSTLYWGDRPCFPATLAPVHFELEWVVRIGQDVPLAAYRSDMDLISHQGMGIDFTARAYQSRLKKAGLPWLLAKNFRHSCVVVGLQEGGPQPNEPIEFQLIQNGTVRQRGDTRNMIFDVPTLLGFLNQTMPLCAGDLMFTGTPEGVGAVEPGDRLQIVCGALNIDRTLHIGQ